VCSNVKKKPRRLPPGQDHSLAPSKRTVVSRRTGRSPRETPVSRSENSTKRQSSRWHRSVLSTRVVKAPCRAHMQERRVVSPRRPSLDDSSHLIDCYVTLWRFRVSLGILVVVMLNCVCQMSLKPKNTSISSSASPSSSANSSKDSTLASEALLVAS
jgi:hypothetical protein